jgi:phospholipid/cholesterol/gamma-HCH transport system substrate-binding protein
METKANYVLIGFFTLAVLAAGFGFVHWFQSIGKTGARANYHVVFQGPVGGLRTGAAVLFNGMRVGEVSELGLNRHDPKQVIATINVDANVPVRSDTYVGLDFQGLTGIASVALRGGDPTAGPLPEGADGLEVLTADPNATQDITAAVREVVHKVDAFLADNQNSLHNSLANIETFTVTLKNNTERLDRIMAGVEDLTGAGPDKPGEMATTLRSVKTLADNVNSRVDEIAPGLVHFSKEGLKQYEALAADGRRTLATFEAAVKNFDRNPQRVLFGGGTPATSAPTTGSTSGRRAQ